MITAIFDDIRLLLFKKTFITVKDNLWKPGNPFSIVINLSKFLGLFVRIKAMQGAFCGFLKQVFFL